MIKKSKSLCILICPNKNCVVLNYSDEIMILFDKIMTLFDEDNILLRKEEYGIFMGWIGVVIILSSIYSHGIRLTI